MKPPDHPTPSGDRQIARLLSTALRQAGFEPAQISSLRTLDKVGDQDAQAELTKNAAREADRLIGALGPEPPALWFTYHCHYKAPDLLGPVVSRALGIPYCIAEPSISPRRRAGPWAAFAHASESAIAAADLLFWTTERDRPALAEAGHTGKMVHLPAFIDPGPETTARSAGERLRLLTIAMMRTGDKAESYRRLAAALPHLGGDWHHDVYGDGPVRPEIEASFARFGERITFHGATDDRDALRRAYEAADIFVWPGVNEGVGLVYLEAQAAGLPVAAEDHPAQRELVAGELAEPENPVRFAALIREIARERCAASRSARRQVKERHSVESASNTLRTELGALLK